MANDGYVTTRKWMSAEQIAEDIREILKRRFKGLMEIAPVGQIRNDNCLFWCQIEPPRDLIDRAWVYQFTVQLLTRRKLTFRHPPNDWAMWASAVVQIELAVKYGGTLSDSGIPDRWQPDLKKFPTYVAWVKMMTQPRATGKIHIAACRYFRNLHLREVPDKLRGL